METLNIVISAGITVLALGLLIISVISYRKYKNTKLFFVGLVFFIFLIKGIILSINVFHGQSLGGLTSLYERILDLIILVLLFIATLKR